MILLVDAGNSRIKWRLRQDGRTHADGELPTSGFAGLAQAWQGIEARAACVCSVAGEAVDECVRQSLGLVLDSGIGGAHWLDARAQAHGLINLYEPPQSLGPDRFAAMVAARRRQESDWLVVNVGTAMTVDMLAADGRFLGGAIVPGPGLMANALARGTARVDTDMSMPVQGPPRDTRAAVSQGIGLALRGVVEGMSGKYMDIVGSPPRVLLSGGARRVLAPLLGGDAVEVDELVLEGLAWIARDLGYGA